MMTRTPVEHADVDFPFAFARPEILAATSDALRRKIFDEIGIMPRTRHADPMVIGRITYRVSSYQRRSLNFLIAWFLDTKGI